MRISVKINIVFAIVILITGSVKGQYKDFEKIFEKETTASKTKNSNQFKNINTLSFYPDTLPIWFFTPPQSSLTSIYAVGISDPDMEPSKAKQMAIHRAKAIAGLYLNAKMQYFRDVYTSAKELGRYTDFRQRFDTYFKISSLSKIDDQSFAVIDSHMTRYNESMILIKYVPNQLQSIESKLLSVTGTVLYIEAQIDEAFEVQAEYELLSAFQQPEAENQLAHFIYREKGNKFLSNSEFLNSVIKFPVYLYRYASPVWKNNTEPLVSYNGLWSKFTRELLWNLTLTTEQSKIKIKNLGEMYNPASSNLTREIISYKAQLKLNGIVFERDSMKLNLSVHEIFSE